MKTFSITSLGCKVNQYEAQQLRTLLESLNLKQVKITDNPQLVIVQSCCVTAIASSKTRQAVAKYKKNSPNAYILLTGCLPNGPKQEVEAIKSISSKIICLDKQTDMKKAIINIINNDYTNKTEFDYKIKQKNGLECLDNIGTISKFGTHSRAFLKVQDGCDGYCTYCIIPKIRSNVCQKPLKTAIKEAQQLVDSGHKEIVLTGIFLGAYGLPTVRRKRWQTSFNSHFVELVAAIAEVKGLKRLRLSSLEPADVTQQLLDVFEAKKDIIAPHLHLPLQSGSDRILRKMGRQYRVKQYLEVVDMVKKRLDKPAITTDIIVGFPVETGEDFLETVNTANIVGFSKMHIFSYSVRKGTAAEKMPNPVPSDIIKARSRTLIDLNGILSLNFIKQFINTPVEIIIENAKNQSGRCQRYFQLQVIGQPQKLPKNTIVQATINPDCKTAEYIRTL